MNPNIRHKPNMNDFVCVFEHKFKTNWPTQNLHFLITLSNGFLFIHTFIQWNIKLENIYFNFIHKFFLNLKSGINFRCFDFSLITMNISSFCFFFLFRCSIHSIKMKTIVCNRRHWNLDKKLNKHFSRKLKLICCMK